MQSEMASPCIDICRLNDDQKCIGCGRSGEEIARWQQYTDAERRFLMQTVLPRRLECMID